jgi:hypothetical protein
MIEPKIPGLSESVYAGEAVTAKGRFVYLAGNVIAGDNPLKKAGYSSVGSRKVLIANGNWMVGFTGIGVDLTNLHDLAGALDQAYAISGAGWGSTGAGHYGPLVPFGLAAPKGVYPVNKLEFQPEDSDHSLDSIASGESCIIYKNGQYETDQWSEGRSDDTSMSAATFGAMLYLDNVGRLTRQAGYVISGYVVARLIQVGSAPATTGAGVDYEGWGGFYPSIEHGQQASSTSAELIWYELLP